MRSIFRTRIITILLYLIVAPQYANATSHSRFHTWFPRYADELTFIVNHNCSKEYAQWNSAEYITPIWRHSGRAGPLINCILTYTPEIIKANFNSAAVVLGLMPPLLAMIGPSVQETSTLLAYGDHPLLALLICLGSPMVGVDRELGILHAFRRFKSKAPSAKNFGLQRARRLVCLEYMITLGAIANMAEVTWELAVKTSFTWFKGDAFEIAIWAFVGFVTHLMGAIALGMRTYMVEFTNEKATDAASSSKVGWLRWRCSSLIPFSLTKTGREKKQQKQKSKIIHVVVNQSPSLLFVLYLMLITFFILFLIFFGTIIFSSILFIGVHNAVQVWMRVTGSAIVCRVLVLTELAIVRDLVEVHADGNNCDGRECKGGFCHCDEPSPQTRAGKGLSQV